MKSPAMSLISLSAMLIFGHLSQAISTNYSSVPVIGLDRIAPNVSAPKPQVIVDDNIIEIGLNANMTTKTPMMRPSSPAPRAGTTIAVSTNNSNVPMFGEQMEDSLLRPLLIKGILNARQRLTGKQTDEDEETVEQTIMVPMAEQSAGNEATQEGSSSETESSVEEPSSEPAPVEPEVTRVEPPNEKTSRPQIEDAQPADSIRLSRTEIDGLLNDKEAPEFYKEREQGGEGIVVREEQRIRTASSDRIPSGHYRHLPGPYLNSPSTGRLLHSASEEYGQPGMFQHRFGQSGPHMSNFYAGGGDEGEPSGPGRLMQSPSHMGDLSEFGPPGTGYGHRLEGASAHGHAGIDYSPHSGLLRAGSGEYEGSSEHGYESGESFGPSAGFGAPSSGYSGSPMLDRHASEYYGPSSAGGGSLGYGSSSDFYSPGRMAAAGSHRHSDEFSSRYGDPFDQQGFASRDRLMLQGNSMTNRKVSDELSPLSPIVPTDESPSASVARESSHASSQGVESDSEALSGGRQSTHGDSSSRETGQVYEAIESDPTSTGEAGDHYAAGPQARPSRHYRDQTRDDRLGAFQGASNYQGYRPDLNEDKSQPSLVLNVPPPSAESRAAVEFSRTGSAGYLAPMMRQSESSALEQRAPMNQYRSSSYDPASNPAHAGKYIID